MELARPEGTQIHNLCSLWATDLLTQKTFLRVTRKKVESLKRIEFPITSAEAFEKKKKKEKEITRSRSPVAQTAIFTQAKSNITKCEDIAARKIFFSNLDKQKYIFIFKDLNSLCAIGGRLDYAACSHVSERCWLTATGEVVAGIEKKRQYANDGLSKRNLGNLSGNYYCKRFRCSDMGRGGRYAGKTARSLFSFFFIWPTLSHIHLL